MGSVADQKEVGQYLKAMREALRGLSKETHEDTLNYEAITAFVDMFVQAASALFQEIEFDDRFYGSKALFKNNANVQKKLHYAVQNFLKMIDNLRDAVTKQDQAKLVKAIKTLEDFWTRQDLVWETGRGNLLDLIAQTVGVKEKQGWLRRVFG